MHIEKGRVGQFFLFIGLLLLVIFFTTDQAKHPQYGFFFIGVIVLCLGIYLIWRDLKPPEESQRFRAFRRWRERGKEKKKEKEEEKRETEGDF
jgi:Na+/phosphate symporter